MFLNPEKKVADSKISGYVWTRPEPNDILQFSVTKELTSLRFKVSVKENAPCEQSLLLPLLRRRRGGSA